MNRTADQAQPRAEHRKEEKEDKREKRPNEGKPQHDDLAHPKQASHSDDERSRLPERDDEHRQQSPADRPGAKPGEGETPVG